MRPMTALDRPTFPPHHPIALFTGEMTAELVALFSDVLSESCIRVCSDLSPGAVPDLLLFAASAKDVRGTVEQARASAAEEIPLVAVLPYEDRRLAKAALFGGADGVYELGTPLARLRIVVAKLLIRRWTHHGRVDGQVGPP
jgi:hypothetical protein